MYLGVGRPKSVFETGRQKTLTGVLIWSGPRGSYWSLLHKNQTRRQYLLKPETNFGSLVWASGNSFHWAFQIHPLVPIHCYWSRFRARALKHHNKIQKFLLWAKKKVLSPSFAPVKHPGGTKKLLVDAKNNFFRLFENFH